MTTVREGTAAAMPTTAEDHRAVARDARAERYFEHDLAGQRRWYGERTARYKTRLQVLGLVVIAAGAASSFLQVFRGSASVPVLTALLGAVIALAEGWRHIARYDEGWAAYRLASERMKHERRVYVNGAGEYRDLVDEEDAFLRFVEAIEFIIAEEQRIYWRSASKGVDERVFVPRVTSPITGRVSVGAETVRTHGVP